MVKKNVTSSGFTPVQVGRVVDGEKAKKPEKKAEKPAPEETGEGTVTNVRSGNARVGKQAGTITGGIRL